MAAVLVVVSLLSIGAIEAAHPAAVRGSGGAVASAAPAATRAGLEILRAGGNAADAAVATALALAVVHPQAGNLGGGGFAVVRFGGVVEALDFRETAPAKASHDMYLDESGEANDSEISAQGQLMIIWGVLSLPSYPLMVFLRFWMLKI